MILKIVSWILFELSFRLLLLILIAQLVTTEQHFEVGDAFVALGLYIGMRQLVLQMMPYGIAEVADALVSIRRIQVENKSN